MPNLATYLPLLLLLLLRLVFRANNESLPALAALAKLGPSKDASNKNVGEGKYLEHPESLRPALRNIHTLTFSLSRAYTLGLLACFTYGHTEYSGKAGREPKLSSGPASRSSR